MSYLLIASTVCRRPKKILKYCTCDKTKLNVLTQQPQALQTKYQLAYGQNTPTLEIKQKSRFLRKLS